jgi:hypothetical protein
VYSTSLLMVFHPFPIGRRRLWLHTEDRPGPIGALHIPSAEEETHDLLDSESHFGG